MLAYLLTITFYCGNIKSNQVKIDCFNKHLHCLEVDSKTYKSGCVSVKGKNNDK